MFSFKIYSYFSSSYFFKCINSSSIASLFPKASSSLLADSNIPLQRLSSPLKYFILCKVSEASYTKEATLIALESSP